MKKFWLYPCRVKLIFVRQKPFSVKNRQKSAVLKNFGQKYGDGSKTLPLFLFWRNVESKLTELCYADRHAENVGISGSHRVTA